MAVRTLNLNSGGLSFVCTKGRTFQEEGGVRRFGFKRVSEFGPRRASVAYRPLVAADKRKDQDDPSSSENNNPSNPEGDDPEGVNPANDKSKSDESAQKYQFGLRHWRDFRANLVAHADELLGSADPTDTTKLPQKRLGPKWAHPLPVPELGCVLIATDKLDRVRGFQRTVVLLLSVGTEGTSDGPFGIIINRPYGEKLTSAMRAHPDLASAFVDSSLFFGGPMEGGLFLVKTGNTHPVLAFMHVVPGIGYGSTSSCAELAVILLKRGALRFEDFKFFVGYMGWEWKQLLAEIESGYWVIASCSSDLIGSVTYDNFKELWAEILQLMGGEYADLSRKPEPDSWDQ